jgi:hypothetical protein
VSYSCVCVPSRYSRCETSLTESARVAESWLEAAATPVAPEVVALRRMTLGIAALVVVQTAVGMIVNLYVTVPAHHPGAQPANYLTGSLRSIAWAIGHGALALAIHASLGIAIVAIAIWVAVRAATLRSGWVTLTSILGAALVIGAAFNGASFVDFNHDVSSLIMALLALGALSCYLVALYLLPGRR